MKFAYLLLLIGIHGWVLPAEAKWSVSSYNIRNFDRDYEAGSTNVSELGKVIKEFRSDVMAFQEVVNTSAFDALIKTNLPGFQYQLSNCGGFGKQNLAVAYNTKVFEYSHHVEDLSFSGSGSTKCGSLRPVLLVTLKHKDTKKFYTFGVVHLKAGGDERAFKQRWQQYSKLEELTKKYAEQNLILLGDFNTTGYNIKNEDYEKFSDLLNEGNLRTTTENLACTNYWQGTLGGPEYQPSILDHIVVQEKNKSSIESVKVGP